MKVFGLDPVAPPVLSHPFHPVKIVFVSFVSSWLRANPLSCFRYILRFLQELPRTQDDTIQPQELPLPGLVGLTAPHVHERPVSAYPSGAGTRRYTFTVPQQRPLH